MPSLNLIISFQFSELFAQWSYYYTLTSDRLKIAHSSVCKE